MIVYKELWFSCVGEIVNCAGDMQILLDWSFYRKETNLFFGRTAIL